MAGLSAGANCWFQSSTTDSFLIGNADVLSDGLGFLGGSVCPHYTAEPERRPNYLKLAAGGQLPGVTPARTGQLCTSSGRSSKPRCLSTVMRLLSE